mgnify:CR=1 FL=1
MSLLTIDFNKKADKKIENYETITGKILSFEDLKFIDNYYQNYKYILIKDYNLKKRIDFEPEEFSKNVLENNTQIDIFILTTYSENCQNLEKITEYKDYNFYKSTMPGEIKSMIFDSKKWPMIRENLKISSEEKITKSLKNLVYSDSVKASFSWPQAYYEKDNLQMLKICRENNIGLIDVKTKDISYYWFLVNLVFSFIFLYVIFDKIPKDRFYQITKN